MHYLDNTLRQRVAHQTLQSNIALIFCFCKFIVFFELYEEDQNSQLKKMILFGRPDTLECIKDLVFGSVFILLLTVKWHLEDFPQLSGKSCQYREKDSKNKVMS